MNIRIPQNAESIINILNKNGYEAYVVGGCVRDTLLGRKPEDWDITTSAKPEEVKNLFLKTIDTGIQHGTVTVRMFGCSYEVTTYRIDGKYEDNRHPKNVEFTSNLIEDLKRRDFTINAMAYCPQNGLVDIFDGVGDLEKGIIRCVGDAKERFDEDALRTLRAVRFSGQLGFDIEKHTLKAIIIKSSNILNVSAERIRVEMTKLITSKCPDRLIVASKTGLTGIFLPEWDKMLATKQHCKHHLYDVGVHSIKVIERVKMLYNGEDPRELQILCWSALLHDVAKPECITTDEDGTNHFYGHPEKGADMALDILKRLKFDNYTINIVSRLVRFHDYRFGCSDRVMRRFLNKAGIDIIPMLLLLMEADIMGQSEYMREEKFLMLKEAKKQINMIIEAKEAVTIKELKINGRDLMESGIPSGRIIGVILEKLLEEVFDNPNNNNRKYLLKKATKILEENK